MATDLWETNIYRGMSWKRTLTVGIGGNPVDLTGYTCTARIGSIELSVGSGVTIDGPAGEVELRMNSSQTELFGYGFTSISIDLVSAGDESLPRIHGRGTVS